MTNQNMIPGLIHDDSIEWLAAFKNTYRDIVPDVCEQVHQARAGVLCGYMSHTMEALSGGRLHTVPGVLIGRQFEGQDPQAGAYMGHWWCEDNQGEIVDFTPLSSQLTFEYIPASNSDPQYQELSNLLLQPMNRTVAQWLEDFEDLRHTPEFKQTITMQVEMSLSAARLT